MSPLRFYQKPYPMPQSLTSIIIFFAPVGRWSTTYGVYHYYSLSLLVTVGFGFMAQLFWRRCPNLPKWYCMATESVVILLLTLFSVGTSTGITAVQNLTKNQISLKLLPIGIIGFKHFCHGFTICGFGGKHHSRRSPIYAQPTIWHGRHMADFC